MKKVFLIASLVVIATASQAQIKYGLKAGANFYQITGKDADDFEEKQKLRIGPSGGAFVNVKLNEIFTLQPEVLYSSEGNLQKEGDLKVIAKLNYVNVPVLFQFNASGFFAETGPQVGFLTAAKIKITDGEDDSTTDIKDELKGVNFSWAVGFGFKTESGFGVGARYNLGLANIADSEEGTIKSSGFHIGVFYTFGGK